jgi:hypothetical protein
MSRPIVFDAETWMQEAIEEPRAAMRSGSRVRHAGMRHEHEIGLRDFDAAIAEDNIARAARECRYLADMYGILRGRFERLDRLDGLIGRVVASNRTFRVHVRHFIRQDDVWKVVIWSGDGPVETYPLDVLWWWGILPPSADES